MRVAKFNFWVLVVATWVLLGVPILPHDFSIVTISAAFVIRAMWALEEERK